jgi:hypothetical protein
VAIFHEKNIFSSAEYDITPHHIFLYFAEKFSSQDLKTMI